MRPADLVGFSRGMFSNWLWHRPLQLLVDAGEGLQLALGARVFGPSYLALTHGHSDHVLGVPGLVAARRFGKGDAASRSRSSTPPDRGASLRSATCWPPPTPA